VLRVAKALKLAGTITLISLALFAGEAGAQASLKPELELAAEVRAIAQACRELQPDPAGPCRARGHGRQRLVGTERRGQ
jgi:hypothetical protein